MASFPLLYKSWLLKNSNWVHARPVSFIQRTGRTRLTKLFCVWIAAIYFKNRLVKAWDRNKQPTAPISEEDRSVVKQSILQAMVTAPNAVK
jgi:hypothetical protein